MAIILEQNEIDNAVEIMQQQIVKSENAKEKIATIYKEYTGDILEDNLETLIEIGSVLTIIESYDSPSAMYHEDVVRLRKGFNKKINK